MRRFNRGSNKYGAKKVEIDGIKFDSKKEGERWLALSLLQKAGHITNLRRQVRVDLMGQHRPMLTRTGRQMHITIDFVYEEDGETTYEDCKGMPTRDYEVRKSAFEAMGYTLRET